MLGLRRQHSFSITRGLSRSFSLWPGDVLAGLIAVAPVDTPAGPNTDHVAFPHTALAIDGHLGPPLRPDRRFQEILGNVMGQDAALQLGGGSVHDPGYSQR